MTAPASIVRSRWKDRGRRAAEKHAVPDGAPEGSDRAVRLAAALAAAPTAEDAAAALLEEVVRLPGVDGAALALLDEGGERATGFAARGIDESRWLGVTIDLEREAAGVATAARERSPVAVYDAASAPTISRRLAASVGAKSAAFVPLAVDARVVAVLVLLATAGRRFFPAGELDALQELAARAAPMLAHARSAEALRQALERERLVAEIARKVRSELDVDQVLEVAVRETGRALGADRCFVRLGEPGTSTSVRSQWSAPEVRPLDEAAPELAASDLAARERRTVAVADVASAPELRGFDAGRQGPPAAGSALAAPIVAFDRTIGVLAAHRAAAGRWSAGEEAVVEAVAGELGLALHAARLLDEDARRLGQQGALLKAAQVVTSDLHFDSVLRRLVDEVATLFGADAADCWMFEPGRDVLRCRAVAGLPESEIGRRIAPAGTHAAAIDARRPVLRQGFARTEDPPPSRNFADFEEVMVAPMTWLGEVRGVLGVCSREPGRFHASELELLDAFARFASLASHNAESFEDRGRQARVQQGFYRIAEVLGSSLSLAETLDALAQAAAEALGGEAAVVLEAGGAGLAPAGSFQIPAEFSQRLEAGIAADSTPFFAAAEEERIVSSTWIADDDRFDDATRALLGGHGYAALLSAPVRRSSGDAAAVVVLFGEERTFSDDDLALARHLSRAARGALERSELFEGERRARGLSQRLATVGAQLVTNLDPDRVLEEVAAEAPVLLGADAALVRLLEGENLVVRAASGALGGGLVGTHAGPGAGLLVDVVQSRRPAAVDDARAAPQLGRGDPLLADRMAACVVAPMTARDGGLYGVLSVYSDAPRAWRPDETQALVALAAMASAALANAELYQGVAEEKERSEAILGNIADGIVAVDRDDRIVLWNAMAEEITGVPAAEALGRRVSEAIQRELASEHGEATAEREVAITRGGKEVWLSLTEAVMRDQSGAFLGRIFAFRDISAERALERMKSDFVATVSHELRTPLTSIYGFAETLLRRDVDFVEEERATFLDYIASESERLIRIVDDLLNVARLEAGTLGLSLTPTDVAAVVRQTLAEVEPELDGQHRFVVELPDGLWAEADRERLREVVGHLVDNAVKYSPEGGTITISGRRRSDTVELRVVDEGVGIPHGDRGRVFTKFFRGDPGPLGSTHGSGVGLFLARGLLAAMRGRIWFQSEEGHGSSFAFELPVSRPGAAGIEQRG